MLANQLAVSQHQPGDVTAGPCQAGRESLLHEPGAEDHDDREGGGRPSRRVSSRVADSHNQIDLESYQLPRLSVELLDSPLDPAPLQHEALALDMPQLLEGPRNQPSPAPGVLGHRNPIR